jgi:hypothetical protein
VSQQLQFPTATEFDPDPAWQTACLLRHNMDRLDPKHHEFIIYMESRTAAGQEPTKHQLRYLHTLFNTLVEKFGGKLT